MTAYTATLNGLTIGDGTVYLWQTEPQGIAPGAYRTSRLQAQTDGARPVGPDLLPTRMVVFDLEVFDGRGYSDGGTLAVEQAADALKAAWAPTRSGVIALTVELANGPRVLFGRPVGIDIDGEDMLYGKARARCEFEATDPRLFAASSSSLVLGLSGVSGGLEYPLTYPLSYGVGSDSDGSADNAGTFETPWTASIVGPVVNPRLTLGSTGEYVELEGTVPEGSTLTLSSSTRAVLLDGSPRQTWLTLPSRWWQLAAGVNTVRFRATSGTGACTFSWRSAWL